MCGGDRPSAGEEGSGIVAISLELVAVGVERYPFTKQNAPRYPEGLPR